MMRARTIPVFGAILICATSLAAHAQTPYPAPNYPVYAYQAYPYPYQPYGYLPSPATAAPPAWSYDPYTSGMTACVQHYPGEPPCKYTVDPTFGQPNYWPR